MSDPNPFITNGTCYHDADETAAPEVLPCGNAALGTKHCCYIGDMCLEETYCLNEAWNMTYTTACTDPAYEEDKCNQERTTDDWTRVMFCVSDANTIIIMDCGRVYPPRDPDDDPCVCPLINEDRYTLKNSFYDDVVHLPMSKGESVIWQPDHVPTSSDVSSSASETGPGAAATVGAGGDGPDDDGGDWQGGLGVGVQAGIGVGVSLAGLLALVVMFSFWRRRAKGARAGAGAKNSAPPGDVAELPVRALTPPPGELEADTSWTGGGSGVEKRRSADADVAGVRSGEAGNDRAERTTSVVSELQ